MKIGILIDHMNGLFFFFYEILIKVEVCAKEKFGTKRVSPSYL